MIKAKLFKIHGEKNLQCLLCAHYCYLKPEQTGKCQVRKNIDGILFSLNSDKIAAMQIDPIEKKPLYHFLPSSQSLSIAAMGCNFKCSFCQNHSLSQITDPSGIFGESISPDEIVNQAKKNRVESISYTYSEPTIYFELMLETAKLAKQEGIKNVMVTNGFFSKEALNSFSPFIDAANIDLKSYSEGFYKNHCKAELNPVLDSIKRTRQKGIWIEITTLLISDLNTQNNDKMIDFILDLDPATPWHVSRFYPQFKESNRPATDNSIIIATLEDGSKKGLKHLYAGNIHGGKWENTYCPQCNNLLIERSGYKTLIKAIVKGRCSHCQQEIAGVW